MLLPTDLDRVPLGEGPTPVRELDGLGGAAPVWIKDDGAFSALGGNKARKLEWLLADARRRSKDTVLTGGALGTNHGLATAVFARRLGMRTILVLAPQPRTEHVLAQLERLRSSGAELHFARGLASSYLLAGWLMLSRGLAPGVPYAVPPGGSNPLGCVGYVEAAFELREQIASGEAPEPSHIVVALGSGGTSAGLLAGLRLAGLRSRLVCIKVSDVVRMGERRVTRLAERTLRLLGRHGVDRSGRAPAATDLTVDARWLGPGYGQPTPEAERAVSLFAARESPKLDPVYTGKAVAALLELNRRGAFGDGPVLYWHTYSPPEAGAEGPLAPGREAESRAEDPLAPGREAEEASGL